MNQVTTSAHSYLLKSIFSGARSRVAPNIRAMIHLSNQNQAAQRMRRSMQLCNQSRFGMSYLSQNTQRFKQIDAEQLPTQNNEPLKFQIRVPFEAQTLQVNTTLSQTLGDLAASLKQQNENIDKIVFYTLDGAIIPNSEYLAHLNSIPFIVTLRKTQSTGDYSYALNLNSSFSIVNSPTSLSSDSKMNEEAYLQYNLGIGLPQYSSFLLANFANKLHHSLPQHKQTVSQEEVLQGLNKTIAYYRSIGAEDDKTLAKVSDLEREISQKQHELYQLNEIKAKLDRKADLRAQAIIFLGSSIFLTFIMSGTFVYYSWDIMEPISYIMMFTNFTVGVMYYAFFRKELALGTVRQSLSGKFAKGLYRRKGLDINRVNQLEGEILNYRAIINQTIK